MKSIKLLLFKEIKQGVTLEKLAKSIGHGIVLGVIPVLGITTGLCALVAQNLKLNHVVIHAVNYLAYPLQLFLLIPFFRIGECIFGQEAVPLYIPDLINKFNENFWPATKEYALTGAMGAFAWLLFAPLLYAAINSLSKVFLKRLL